MSLPSRRLLVIPPRWRDPLGQDWTGCRHWLRYTIVAQWWDEAADRWSREYVVVARTRTWDAAADVREHIRRYQEAQP